MVEDEFIAHFVQRKMLEQLGYSVDIAETAAEAIAMYGKGYDVILMDVGLPDGNGLEVTAQIRQYENGKRRTPIIAITAFPLHEVEKDCIAAGMDAVLKKPVNLNILKSILRRVLRNKEN